MKRSMKKLLALALIAALLVSVMSMAAYAAAPRVPVICVTGELPIEVYREDGSSYIPTEGPADEIMNEAIKELVPVFLKAMLTNNYDEWSRRALEKLTPIYDEIRPNLDGSLPANTGINYSWSPETMADPVSADYYYTYTFDYRISPLDAAEGLRTFIDAVKAKTGSDKVALISRCGSTSLGAAYLYKYGADDLTSLTFFSSSLLGVPYADTMLGGRVVIPGDMLYHFVACQNPLASFNERLNEFAKAVLYALNENASADDVINLVLRVYDKVKDSFVSPFLRSYYAVCPNFVATVNDSYERYRNFIFPTDELKQEYAVLLAKTDEYHYNVQQKLGELFTAARDGGVPVNFVVVYGEPSENVNGERTRLVGDELTDACYQSMGATVPFYAHTLEESYISERTAAGFGKYISPDKMIDASTCLFPDNTWFIRNLRHEFSGQDVIALFKAIAWTEDMTVFADPAFPQFLNARPDHSGFDPAQETNPNDINPDDYKPEMNNAMGFLARVIAFYAKLITRFAGMIAAVRNIAA
ncbi:MAG: hypothetical protein IJK89_12560 [Clostridia bacterium]|nr:hypothetical protein [Clostridia bacterium]